MVITEKLIREELGLLKNYDIENKPYFQFRDVGHFYWQDGDTYYFRADEWGEKIEGMEVSVTTSNWNKFKEMFL